MIPITILFFSRKTTKWYKEAQNKKWIGRLLKKIYLKGDMSTINSTPPPSYWTQRRRQKLILLLEHFIYQSQESSEMEYFDKPEIVKQLQGIQKSEAKHSSSEAA